MIRVYLITPLIAVRAGLRSLLLDDQQVDVIGETDKPYDHIKKMEPDVVIWAPAELSAQKIPIEEFIKSWDGLPVALVLIHTDPGLIEKLVKCKARVWGMLSPETTRSELIAAVKAVSEGLVVINSNRVQYMINPPRNATADGEAGLLEPLTGREMDILQLLAVGLTNKQIAVKLGISTHTVKFHVSSLFNKMGTSNRTETVNLGYKLGLILL